MHQLGHIIAISFFLTILIVGLYMWLTPGEWDDNP